MSISDIEIRHNETLESSWISYGAKRIASNSFRTRIPLELAVRNSVRLAYPNPALGLTPALPSV